MKEIVEKICNICGKPTDKEYFVECEDEGKIEYRCVKCHYEWYLKNKGIEDENN